MFLEDSENSDIDTQCPVCDRNIAEAGNSHQPFSKEEQFKKNNKKTSP